MTGDDDDDDYDADDVDVPIDKSYCDLMFET